MEKTVLIVSVAKYRLDQDPTSTAEHWALCFLIGGQKCYYEVAGTSKHITGVPNVIYNHEFGEKYTHYDLDAEVTFHGDPRVEIQQWCDEWIKKHPYYEFNGDNCQRFVQDFYAHWLGIAVPTQNKQKGDAGMIFFGFTLVVSIVGILFSSAIKGNH